MTDPTDFSAATDLSRTLAGVVAAVAPSLVSIHAGRTPCSGFVWQPGLIVTSDEALPEEGEAAVTLPDGTTLAAHRAGRDPTTAIALLRIERSDLPQVTLATPQTPVGSLAMAIGADDDAPTAAFGVVSRASGPWRSLRGGEIDARIELDLRLRRSAEGGLAVDAAGQVFGMLVFGPRRRVLVIPTATIERVAPKLARDGRIARGYLGLGMQPVAIEGGGAGVMVMSVDPRGPGKAAGIHQGDILIALNGEPIRQVQSLLRSLGPDSIGRTMTLDLRRGGVVEAVPVTIAERAAAERAAD